MRRTTRPLFVLLILIGYVVLVARLAGRQSHLLAPDAAILDGVVREIFAGSTPGRQALVGSIWQGPLPMLLHLSGATILLPFKTLAPAGVPLAVWLSALMVIAGSLLVLLRSATQTRLPTLPLALLPVLPAGLALALPGSAEALTFPLALLLVFEGANWLQSGLLRHLVTMAFVMAALLLCGLQAWGWVIFGALIMLGGGLARRRLLRRVPALLLLGWLPAVYAFAVWALLNWLILGDTVFFLRVLGTMAAPVRPALAALVQSPWDAAALVVCLTGLVTGIVGRDGRRIGYGLAGLAAFGWLACLAALNVAWLGQATWLTFYGAALLSLTHLTQVAGRHFAHWTLLWQCAAIAAIVACGGLRTTLRAPFQSDLSDAEVLAAVTADVQEHSRHARIFVAGYEGLGLLQSRPEGDDLFTPLMDLHLGSLRHAYWGQTLYILAHKPVGPSLLENIIWRAPDFYQAGAARTLLTGDFGDWRLYELVTAPTLRELQHQQSPAEPADSTGHP